MGRHETRLGPLWDVAGFRDDRLRAWLGLAVVALGVAVLVGVAVVQGRLGALGASALGLVLVLVSPGFRPPTGVVPATAGVVVAAEAVLGARMPGGQSFVGLVSILAFGLVFDSLALHRGPRG